jgi:hypothetical protein
MAETVMTKDKDNDTTSLSHRETAITLALISPLVLILALILGIMVG